MSHAEPCLRFRAVVDWLVSAALFLLTFSIYLRTLAPTVAYLFDDSLEFQLLAPRMAIAHPTGYPLYSILIKLATFLPFGDVAYRVNLVSALSGALAVAFAYLAARLITARFISANTTLGEILSRAPALIAALVFAFGETFWSQAVIAEVYAPQALLTALILWLTLRWGHARDARREARAADTHLMTIAFFAGLMLTHHRLSVLIFPALVVYVLSYDRALLRQPRTLIKVALAFALPLLLYLYLPIRGTVTSSLDGAYRNTLEGFLNWVLGTAYTVFVTQNPLNQERDAAYYWNLLVGEFTPLGLLVAGGGFVALFLRAWREWLLLALGLGANLVFVLTYRVADINVFFIPTFLFAAFFLAAGLAGSLWLAYYMWSDRLVSAAAAIGALVLFSVPLSLYRDHYARVDLSNKWDVNEYGHALLAQLLPENATLIGILGEMTLVRYFQETQGLHPELETIAADREEERFREIDDALKRGRTVYLTRPLAGIEKEESLSSVGPLIQVSPKVNKKEAPAPAVTLDADFGDMRLLGYTREPPADGASSSHAMSAIPLTLYWQAARRVPNNRLVSFKLLGADGNLAGQVDRQPVGDAYPTSAWRSGEYVADFYTVPIFVGAAPGEYTLQVTMYDPESGEVYGQRELERVNVRAQTQSVPRELLGVNEIVLHELGGMELVGYELDASEPYVAGASVPVTLLWRASEAGAVREIELTITDPFGQVVHAQTATIGEGNAAAGQYLRQSLAIPLPNSLVAGKYPVRVNVKGGGFSLPFQSNSQPLGTIEVTAP